MVRLHRRLHTPLRWRHTRLVRCHADMVGSHGDSRALWRTLAQRFLIIFMVAFGQTPAMLTCTVLRASIMRPRRRGRLTPCITSSPTSGGAIMFKFFTVAVCQTPAVLTRSWGVKRFGQLSLLMWARGAQAEWTLELGQALARKGACARTLTSSKEVTIS